MLQTEQLKQLLSSCQMQDFVDGLQLLFPLRQRFAFSKQNRVFLFASLLNGEPRRYCTPLLRDKL